MGSILFIDFCGGDMRHILKSWVHKIILSGARIEHHGRELDLYIDHTMGGCACFNPLNFLEPFFEEIVRTTSVWRKICAVGLEAGWGFGSLRYDWYVGTILAVVWAFLTNVDFPSIIFWYCREIFSSFFCYKVFYSGLSSRILEGMGFSMAWITCEFTPTYG